MLCAWPFQYLAVGQYPIALFTRQVPLAFGNFELMEGVQFSKLKSQS